MALSKGQKVESFNFSDQTGKTWNFPDDFKDQKLALFFLRHLGCPLCKEKVDELKTKNQMFLDKGVKLAVLVQSTPKRVSSYSIGKGLPYLLVADREKRLFDHFQVKRGGLKEFMAPAALKASLRATFKGHAHGKFEGDELQVPASFLLSGEGEVLYAYYGKDISDFGSADDLLASV